MSSTEALSQLTPEQFRSLARGKAGAIPRQPRDGTPLPLAHAQQQLWFLAQAQGASGAYHISLRLDLRGALDVEALHWALGALLARHESLRTSFHSLDGTPHQRIAPPELAFPLRRDDLGAAADPEAALRALLETETDIPFDLTAAPLIRGRLIRVDDARHVLALTLHHIVSDGWSMGVISRELNVLYAARRRGETPDLPPPAVQYPDYAAWERQRFQGERLAREAEFWMKALDGAPALLELPTDRGRPAVQDFRGTQILSWLDAPLSQGLKDLAQRTDTTPFMVALAALSATLARLSGQRDIVIGTPSANRSRSDLSGVVGLFANTLALRVPVNAQDDTHSLLARARQASLDAQAHQELSFDRVVEHVNPPRSLAHGPIFQVMLSWQPADFETVPLDGLDSRRITLPPTMIKFDLTFTLCEVDDRIRVGLEYASALFDVATAERFARYFERIVRGMVQTPQMPVLALPILDEAERAQVLYAWNQAEAPLPAQCLHEAFEAQARRTPQAVALRHAHGALRYEELNARANRLARHLRGLGVGPDVRVGICVPRTPEMVVAMLAVLKAGGAYVPLDPNYPAERLAGMLEDARPVVALTAGAGAEALAEALMAVPLTADGAAIAALDLGADAARWAHESDAPLAPAQIGLTPSHLAYLIYTSGSTGRPKGVAIEHRNAVNFVAWALREFDAQELRNVLFATSINFDLSIFECFVPLSCGGSLSLAENALALLDAPADSPLREVSLINTVPSAIAELVKADAVPACVRTINLAGEALTRALGERILANPHLVRLCNLYGPSETTTYSTWVAMPRESGFAAHIGGPVANTRLYVLDEFRNPQPVGVAGELYIAGDGVARGYLDRPELTAERFLDDPFVDAAQAGTPGARMYRTGDLVRWRADGTLDYLGRNDFQVKIRGFRIELGEIETRLTAQPGVREAVVLAREDVPGDKRLVAYCLSDDGAIDPAALRLALQQQLPEYMVPSAFVGLAAWPLTPNGKLDRKALPAPDGATSLREYVAPEGPIEAVLATLWCELLRVERVGRQDHFFELGGHSLLAVRLAARVRQMLRRETPPMLVFSAPTLEAYAARLAQIAPERRVQGIPQVDRSAPLRASFAQQRLWFVGQMDGLSEAYHVPMGLKLEGALDTVALRAALDALIARHEALRTTFYAIDGEPHQRIGPPDLGVLLREDDISAAADVESALHALLAEETAAPFDFVDGPLLRARLVRLGVDLHVLVLVMHHIISDGWSLGVLVRELGALYAAHRRGDAAPLAPLAIQYADYAAWQRTRLQGERLEREGAYWRETLRGAPALLDLPTDHKRPPQQDYRGALLELRFDRDLVESLKALGQRTGGTLFMTLMAAWAAVLSRLAGQDEVVVGTPTANRSRNELSGLIGFFVNTLALRVSLDKDQSVLALLEQVKSRALEAMDHQDLPFEQVVEQVNPPRSLAYAPLFQTMFAWQNNEAADLDLDGVRASTLRLPHTGAKFDLTLSLAEQDGGIVGSLEYASSLFERATAERIARCLQRLLRAMAAQPERPILALPMLELEDQRLVVERFSAPDVECPIAERPVHAAFEAHAAAHPDALALTCADVELSYGELNARANRLARHLRAQGVGPEVRVALCVQRSHFGIEAVLAVMKAGGAYVPVDPSYPQERIAEMLGDARPALVLTDSASRAATEAALSSEGLSVSVIDVIAERETWASQSVADLAAEETGLTLDTLAYVIYTSGSTGKPKGVMMPHRGPATLMQALREPMGLDADTRVLQFASFSFDAFVLEWVMAFGWGGSLHLGTPGELLLGDALEALVDRRRTTHCFLTPTLLMSLPEHARLASMHTMTCGGEAITPQVLQRWAPGRRFVNVYGPTETTAITLTCDYAAEYGAETMPIGRPLGGERVYILDAHLQPVPPGVSGELYIGGAGVARGYLDRVELTAERFIDSPFVRGDRLYKTGDVARWRNDGRIEYLGRNDFQVKLRGYRIELGEIETRLMAQPGVKEAVVLAREDVPGQKQLVAYVLADADASEEQLAATTLRAALLPQLPEYMVPAVYLHVDAWPLTSNGKLDRKALPAPDAAAFGARSAYVAPRSPIEEVLADIWSELLGVKPVGVFDNFFDLGGHSLLAMRLIAAIRDTFGIELPLKVFFESPTIEHLGRTLLPEELVAES